MEMFHNSGKYLGTYNDLKPIGGSEMDNNTLGGWHSGEIVDIVQTALSLPGVEDYVFWVSRWASNRYMWVLS